MKHITSVLIDLHTLQKVHASCLIRHGTPTNYDKSQDLFSSVYDLRHADVSFV